MADGNAYGCFGTGIADALHAQGVPKQQVVHYLPTFPGLFDAGGMVADLLIVDGDPIQDILRVADRSNHRMVIKGGKRIDGAEAVRAEAAPARPLAASAS